MPLYNYECPYCGEIVEAFKSVDERNYMVCNKCNCPMEIIIVTPPNHPREMLRHFDKGLGCYVEDRAHRTRLMKERGLREAGDPGDPITKELRQVREQELDGKETRRR
jgi:predicted nucleic acid-binding Zn ribbon protein